MGTAIALGLATIGIATPALAQGDHHRHAYHHGADRRDGRYRQGGYHHRREHRDHHRQQRKWHRHHGYHAHHR